MSVVDQFVGVDLKDLISAPLQAAADAGVSLAKSTARFIDQMGFESGNRVKTATFGYKQKIQAPDGNLCDNEMNIDIPLLSIVPIPNLQADEISVAFDMEIKSSARTAGVNGGISMKGCVASGNPAGYHVDIKAVRCKASDGLTRVLDIMASSISPHVVSAVAVDESGMALRGEEKEKHDRIKLLSRECTRLEAAEKSAEENYAIKLKALTDNARIRRDKTLGELGIRLNAIKIPENMSEDSRRIAEEERASFASKAKESEAFWNSFISAGADSAVLLSLNSENALLQERYGFPDEYNGIPDLSDLEKLFAEAIAAMKTLKSMTERLNNKRYELNSIIIGE